MHIWYFEVGWSWNTKKTGKVQFEGSVVILKTWKFNHSRVWGVFKYL